MLLHHTDPLATVDLDIQLDTLLLQLGILTATRYLRRGNPASHGRNSFPRAAADLVTEGGPQHSGTGGAQWTSPLTL